MCFALIPVESRQFLDGVVLVCAGRASRLCVQRAQHSRARNVLRPPRVLQYESMGEIEVMGHKMGPGDIKVRPHLVRALVAIWVDEMDGRFCGARPFLGRNTFIGCPRSIAWIAYLLSYSVGFWSMMPGTFLSSPLFSCPSSSFLFFIPPCKEN
jgi:hypothetical protein